MSRDAVGGSDAGPDHDDPGRRTGDAGLGHDAAGAGHAGNAGRQGRFARPGGLRVLGRRLHGGGPATGRAGLACPDCGLTLSDDVAARLGFCARCQDFTGMCGAGRKILCPDMMTMTTWHTPCVSLGAVAWVITQGQTKRVTMLCGSHDAEVRAGRLPWITNAVPLAIYSDS
jgi:hypothetical protein